MHVRHTSATEATTEKHLGHTDGREGLGKWGGGFFHPAYVDVTQSTTTTLGMCEPFQRFNMKGEIQERGDSDVTSRNNRLP